MNHELTRINTNEILDLSPFLLVGKAICHAEGRFASGENARPHVCKARALPSEITLQKTKQLLQYRGPAYHVQLVLGFYHSDSLYLYPRIALFLRL